MAGQYRKTACLVREITRCSVINKTFKRLQIGFDSIVEVSTPLWFELIAKLPEWLGVVVRAVDSKCVKHFSYPRMAARTVVCQVVEVVFELEDQSTDVEVYA